MEEPACSTKVLSLADSENFETSLFKLQKGERIKFILDTSLQPHDVSLFCNYPSSKNEKFLRSQFFQLQWIYPFKCKGGDGDRYATLDVTCAGTFNFYALKNNVKCCQGFFIVQPSLTIGTGDLPLDSVVLQTVLAKSLGHFEDWEKRLEVAKESGYNMIHFTPMQELGKSNSSYSLQSQLHINSAFSSTKKKASFEDVKVLVNMMQSKWNMLSLTDVVWNHTANSTEWLQEHPEATYNLENSPHLRPAFLLDRALWYFNREIGQGKWTNEGLPCSISSDYHLERITHIYWNFIVPSLKLEEYYMIDVEECIRQFRIFISSAEDKIENKEDDKPEMNNVKIIQDPLYRKFKSSVNFDAVLSVLRSRLGSNKMEDVLEGFVSDLKTHLLRLNEEKIQLMIRNHEVIIFNLIGGIKYRYLEANGPRHKKVTDDTPITTRYFYCEHSSGDLESDEKLMNSEKARFVFAHPGWVMNGDALKDFAASDSQVYLKRELIAWGDSVKLRYGSCENDCPFLWNHMKKYTQLMASIFHGIRLDNCHSTPIAVAEYLLDAAREVNPDLYVVAELFTNSEAVDNTFINRLGINSLIREKMSASDSRDLGRLMHRYGGEPVGSFFRPSSSPLTATTAHALFMDLTHDNRSPTEVNSVYDYLPSAALVAATSCAIGSSRGYDELVPHHINVVEEKRLYRSWSKSGDSGAEFISLETGIIKAKRALNKFHIDISNNGFSQIYVDQVDDNIISVTRHCPATHTSLIVVAHTAFRVPPKDQMPTTKDRRKPTDYIPALVIPGVLDEIVLEAMFLEDLEKLPYERCNEFINGPDNYTINIQEHIKIADSMVCRSVEPSTSDSSRMTEVYLNNFPPGCVVIFKVSLQSKTKRALQNLRSALNMFPEQRFPVKDEEPSRIAPIKPIIENLTLGGLNRILYRCSNEEVDDAHGSDVYVIPNFGPLKYCGLQGFISVLSRVRASNDLAHPICENLRAGDWMTGYVSSRLKHNHLTRPLGLWLESVFSEFRELPRFLVPCYFDAVLVALYVALVEYACSRMSRFIQDGSTMTKYLAMGSIQLCGLTNNAPLPKLSATAGDIEEAVTMAAGLPHFSTGMWRCWGRDTFIAARGMLLLTGRFSVARNLILAFGGCIRHGLVANLLNKGTNARYNCRDAPWWWLQVIKDFCKLAPDGVSILDHPVARMYPQDDSTAKISESKEQPLYDIMQEVLQRHVHGISFRERNAGPGLDQNMTEEGFHVSAGVDLETGFPFGGNRWNCGTWMDKVGGSHTAGNWGHPATPRDGSAVEIVGLCKSVVTWLAEVYEDGKYPYEGVKTAGSVLHFKQWAEKLQSSFEREFWISESPDLEREGEEGKLVHRRGIYKDCHEASHRFTDYQLRPNFPIAMAVAPELFNVDHALHALKIVEENLTGPLGLRTLDPRDWAYDGFYENHMDSTDFKKALGFNYHQGPEWVWIYGPFLRAKLHFAKVAGSKESFMKEVTAVKVTLARHKEELLTSPWRGLPELTNKDGGFCDHSCPTQAWSMACILEVLYDMEQLLAECG